MAIFDIAGTEIIVETFGSFREMSYLCKVKAKRYGKKEIESS